MNPHADSEAGGSSALLTYEPFFELREKPFSLAADPSFFYESTAHRDVFDALSAGIRRREGLIVLSGEIGTGKTMVCRAVLSRLDRKTFATFVPDPFVTREDLLKTMLVGFGIISVGDLRSGRLHGASRQDLSYPLYEFLDSLVPLHAYAVLVIDEAQNLSLGVMEEIRILAELEKREKLLQVVLVGQPELRDNLHLPQMRQVEQRVTVRCELGPLTFREAAAYVEHRLNVAALKPGGVVFTGGALEAVHLAAGGVPRLINRICDRALQRGFESGRRTIDRDIVEASVRDLDLDQRHAVSAADPSTVVLPLPFDPELDLRPAPAPHETTATATGPAPQESPRPEPPAAAEFPPEPAEAPRRPEPSNPLTEFDTEPESPSTPDVAATPNAPATPASPSTSPFPAARHLPPPDVAHATARSVFLAVTRALGLAVVVFGVVVAAGVVDLGRAIDLVLPAPEPALPQATDRTATVMARALQPPDALTAALIDGRTHEADMYSVQVASFQDRSAADRLVAELVVEGYHARWVETRVDADAEQKVYVDRYGTFEDALATLARLRRQPGCAGARLFSLPGAIRRP